MFCPVFSQYIVINMWCSKYLTGTTSMFLSRKILSASTVVGPLAPSAMIWWINKAKFQMLTTKLQPTCCRPIISEKWRRCKVLDGEKKTEKFPKPYSKCSGVNNKIISSAQAEDIRAGCLCQIALYRWCNRCRISNNKDIKKLLASVIVNF